MASDSEYSFLWVLYFLLVVVIIGIPTCAVTIPLMLLGRLLPSVQRFAEVFFAGAVKLMFIVEPWLKLETSFPEPRPGTLMVSNHRSHLDVFVLLAKVPGVHVLARQSLLWCLPIAPMLIVTRQILVKRGDPSAYLKAMDRIRERLKKGEIVHVFPEMTRCEPGSKGTRNFSSAAFLAAIQAGASIVPVVFHNTDEAWPKGRLSMKPTRLRVEMLPKLNVGVGASANDVRNEARRAINEALA
jgi:1-acyl-sn-glycerol-3-phosphate acyltransferase